MSNAIIVPRALASIPDGTGRSTKAFPSQWPSPQEFLERHPRPTPDDFKPLLDIPLLELLVFYLYADMACIRDFIFHLEEDEGLLKKKVKASEALNWLEEISYLLAEAGETAAKYEIRRHGEPYFIKRSKEGEETGVAPNLPFSAELFSLSRLISYDPETQQYYRYVLTSGLWVHLTDGEVKKAVAFYFKDFADKFDGAFRGKLLTDRNNRFLDEFRKLVASFTYFGKRPKARFVHAQNTMVPLESGKATHPFSPIFFSKNQIETEYDKNAYCARFLDHFLKCAVEPEDIDLLQLWAGSALLGENFFHKIMLITGAGGSGKSTFVNIIERIIGVQNSVELRVPKLDERFEIGRFLDKTLLVGRDVSDDFLNNDGAYKLKGLTGGDTYTVELKHSNERIPIVGKFNVVVTCNAKLQLQLQGDEDAWRRRIWLVEFKKLKAFKKNVELTETLIREEGPGILNWMLKGAKQILHLVRTRGEVQLTKRQMDRINNLLDGSKSLAVFVEERIVLSTKTGEDLATSEIFEAYEQFCVEKDWPPMGEREAQHEIRAQMKKIHNENRRTDIKRDGKNVRGYAHVKFAC